jgi:tetratricopeptide (TPR) repeat protein
VTPDAGLPGQLEEPPPPPPDPGGESLSRRVAVLIMVVTLLGSVFAFLQTSASNRAALAARRSETAAVEAMGRQARGGGHIAVEQQISAQVFEEWYMADSLLGSPSAGEVAAALALALDAQRLATIPYSDLVDYQREDGSVDWGRFVEETLAPSYRAAEYQLAYAEERQEWGAKAGAYVAVVTVLAVALFLIGLSRTVAPGSGGPLVAAGAALAAVVALSGFVVFLRPVVPPSAEAIDAYVAGKVAFNAVLWEADPELVRPELAEASEAFTRAIEIRPDYANAYGGRGVTLFRLDLLAPGGPVGSAQAAADFARVVIDNPLDAVAWGNLGAARFWLGDLEGAGEATRRALGIDPEDPTFNLNLGLFLSLTDDEEGYPAQLGRIEQVLTADDVPTWLRRYLFRSSTEVLDLAAEYRPEMRAAVQRFREDLLRLDHQIAVGKQYFGSATPAEIEAAVSPLSFVLSEDRTLLSVAFDATGVVAGQRWLWRTYRDGEEDPTLSHEPEVWPFAVPDQQVTITLTDATGFAAGVTVRVEVFIEGNLLQAGEFTP